MTLHPDAKTTPYARELIVDRVLRLGWSVEDAAQAAAVSVRTVYRWMARYREEGVAGLHDRSCCARRIAHRTPARRALRIERLRRGKRLTGVFDWSKVTLAEPEYDVAATCARLTSTVPGVPLPLALLFRTVQRGLQRRYLRCYRRTRGLDEKRVAAYEAYWILHELVWSGRRLGEGMRFDGKIETRWLHPDAISAGVARFREITGVALQPRQSS